MHRKSSRTPVLSPVAAIVLALLLSLRAAAQAQGAAGLSCGPEDPQQPGSSGGASAAPEPQCWEGTLQANAQGNIYNDTADGKFKFTSNDDDTVNGNAHIRMSHAPATMLGGCIFTRSQGSSMSLSMVGATAICLSSISARRSRPTRSTPSARGVPSPVQLLEWTSSWGAATSCSATTGLRSKEDRPRCRPRT